MRKQTFATLLVSGLVVVFVSPASPAAGASNHVQKGEMAGYLFFPRERVEETYNAGFSMYVAAWPLLEQYPGSRFQTGLPSTWMRANQEHPSPIERMYSCIEVGYVPIVTRQAAKDSF
jgi:hypothetical protein